MSPQVHRRLPGMSAAVRARRLRLALRAAGAGLAWSLGLLLTALLTPLYDRQTSADANGLTLSTATYVQRNGSWVLIPLALPLIASVAAAGFCCCRSRSCSPPPCG